MDEKQQRLQRKLKSELGNLILDALEDKSVFEILLNPDGSLWVERLGEEMKRVGNMTAINAESLMNTIADSLGTEVSREKPVLEGELPIDGSRFEGLLPPVVARPTFTIRKAASVVFTLDEYVEQGVMSSHQKQMIQQAVASRMNILVVGGTGSGKTTLTNAIIKCVTDTHANDRLVIIEDTREIQCSAENAVQLRTSQEVDMLKLLRATMRLRPDRILVGEVRGAEALSLLKAWNTGHPGGVATVHANGAAAGLVRIEQLVSEAGNIAGVSSLIHEAVDLVIAIQKCKGGRTIKEILDVKGRLDVKAHKTKTIKELTSHEAA